MIKLKFKKYDREKPGIFCFTSVDFLNLLEALSKTTLSVPEKNRIRRSLDKFVFLLNHFFSFLFNKKLNKIKKINNSFQPITVSKNRQQHEDLFKLIMGFPRPKPRNFEKDIKVFLWEILPSSLMKILFRCVRIYFFFLQKVLCDVFFLLSFFLK